MSIAVAFLIYVTVFRLAIIAAGIVSIVLGYRLFVKGVWPEVGTPQGTTVSVETGGSRFTLKNAAPGSCFALFGVLIIAVMFAAGSPQLTLDMLKRTTGVEGKGAVVATGLTLRGDAESLKAMIERGDDHAQRQETQQALVAYREAVTTMATPMNHLAWFYLQAGKADDAFPLAQLAVQLRPDEANFLDTLAEILFQRGEYPEALRYMKKAANLKPDYASKLPKFREANKQAQAKSETRRAEHP